MPRVACKKSNPKLNHRDESRDERGDALPTRREEECEYQVRLGVSEQENPGYNLMSTTVVGSANESNMPAAEIELAPRLMAVFRSFPPHPPPPPFAQPFLTFHKLVTLDRNYPALPSMYTYRSGALFLCSPSLSSWLSFPVVQEDETFSNTACILVVIPPLLMRSLDAFVPSHCQSSSPEGKCA